MVVPIPHSPFPTKNPREDEGLVAVAKPAGISSEKALEAMAACLSKPLFAVSRLDLPTSGVLPAALGTEQSPEARWYLAQFAAHSVEKTYLCLCQGTEGSLGEVGAEGSVELPLKVVATSRSTSRAVPSAEGKRARTDFEVLAVFAEDGSSAIAMHVTVSVEAVPLFRKLFWGTFICRLTLANSSTKATSQLSLIEARPRTGKAVMRDQVSS